MTWAEEIYTERTIYKRRSSNICPVKSSGLWTCDP